MDWPDADIVGWGQGMGNKEVAGAVGRVVDVGIAELHMGRGDIAEVVVAVGKECMVDKTVAEEVQGSLQGAGKGLLVGVQVRRKRCRRGPSRGVYRKDTLGACVERRAAGRVGGRWAGLGRRRHRGKDSCRRSWTRRPGKGGCSWTCCGGGRREVGREHGCCVDSLEGEREGRGAQLRGFG